MIRNIFWMILQVDMLPRWAKGRLLRRIINSYIDDYRLALNAAVETFGGNSKHGGYSRLTFHDSRL